PILVSERVRTSLAVAAPVGAKDLFAFADRSPEQLIGRARHVRSGPTGPADGTLHRAGGQLQSEPLSIYAPTRFAHRAAEELLTLPPVLLRWIGTSHRPLQPRAPRVAIGRQVAPGCGL